MYCWLLLLAAILVAVPAAVAADGDKDPYLWLEDVTGEKALAWVKERNAESTAELTKGPEFQALNERLQAQVDTLFSVIEIMVSAKQQLSVAA